MKLRSWGVSEEKIAFVQKLKRAYRSDKEGNTAFLGYRFLHGTYISHTDERLNYANLAHKKESALGWKEITGWIGISKSSETGTLLRLHREKKNFYSGNNFRHNEFNRNVKTIGFAFRGQIRRVIQNVFRDSKTAAYTTRYFPNMENFSLQLEHSLPETGREDQFYFGAEPGFMLDGLLEFGNLAPHFMNVTTVRLELVYDLITDGYEIDLPGDGSDLTPHTLEEQCELPVQLPLMLEKVVLTFIRNKEHLGRPNYRLRRITDDNENEGGEE